MFCRGYVYKRQGVPELVKIMYRSEFIDMSSKLSAASRGDLGEEKEHKHWQSRQSLYKTMLKYRFQGMNSDTRCSGFGAAYDAVGP